MVCLFLADISGDIMTRGKNGIKFKIMDYNKLIESINACISIVENSVPTRERSLVKTKLEEALLWLGQDNRKNGESEAA